VNTLLDPRFKYPDLVMVAEAMVAGTVSTSDACALARKVTGGEIRETSVGRSLIIGPQEGAERVLAALQAYCKSHDQRTAERWAAFALVVEAQLGVGGLDPEAEGLGLTNALRVLTPCLKATGARCPPEAVEFAVHAVDSVLQSPACTDPDLRLLLTAARSRFAECSDSTSG